MKVKRDDIGIVRSVVTSWFSGASEVDPLKEIHLFTRHTVFLSFPLSFSQFIYFGFLLFLSPDGWKHTGAHKHTLSKWTILISCITLSFFLSLRLLISIRSSSRFKIRVRNQIWRTTIDLCGLIGSCCQILLFLLGDGAFFNILLHINVLNFNAVILWDLMKNGNEHVNTFNYTERK